MSRGNVQRATYLQRSSRPNNRNRGPQGPDSTLPHVVFFVVVDQTVPAGMVMGGRIVPLGTVLAGIPLAGPLHSWGRARKAMLHARRNGVPFAYVVRYRSHTPHVGPFAPTLVPPRDAPAGWRAGIAGAVPDLASTLVGRSSRATRRRR